MDYSDLKFVQEGKRYGYLKLTGVYIPYHKDGDKQKAGKAECLCDCGNIVYKTISILDAELKTSHQKTCSPKCKFYEHPRSTNGRVKDANGNKTKEYAAWGGMKRRCNPDYSQSVDYYDRGITVYPEWKYSFEEFFDHIGPAPSREHSLDRIDNDKSYEPGNVRWATRSEQNNNRRTIWAKEEQIRLLKAENENLEERLCDTEEFIDSLEDSVQVAALKSELEDALDDIICLNLRISKLSNILRDNNIEYNAA